MAKKITAILILCAALFSASQAQKIESGSKWWDGYALWTAIYEENLIVMSGELPNGDMDIFQIYKLNGKDEYAFTSDRPYFNKFNADLSCTLKYIRKDGMYFIAVRNKKGETVWIFVLTPDNLENCTAQQKALEGELPSNLLCNTLLNAAYLDFFSKEELRLMRNEIMARHGYTFTSDDLKKHFEKELWYFPLFRDVSKNLSDIESKNVTFIQQHEK